MKHENFNDQKTVKKSASFLFNFGTIFKTFCLDAGFVDLQHQIVKN